jgi:hypothetical protein
MQLVTGYTGTPHVSAQDDSIRNVMLGEFGGRGVFPVLNQFEATAITANEVRVQSGYGINQGRLFKIDRNAYDSLTIENGTAGMKRADLIVARYTRDEQTGIEGCELVVIKGTAGSTYVDPTYTTGDILQGALQDDMLMYRVKINGVAIEGIDELFTTYRSLIGGIEPVVSSQVDADFDSKLASYQTRFENMITTDHNANVNQQTTDHNAYTQMMNDDDSAFDTWFASVQALIDEQTATRLANAIAKHDTNFASVEASTTASKAYAVGDLLVYQNNLYEVVDNIASGGTIDITSGGNAIKCSIYQKIKGMSEGYVGAGRLSNTTVGPYSTAEGSNTTASAECTHAEGDGTVASGYNAHAEGGSSIASGHDSHAEGYSFATGPWAHSEGISTTASGEGSHVEGKGSTTTGNYSHAEGENCNAEKKWSHAEGYDTTADGSASHAEGWQTTSSGNDSHAEGTHTTASGDYSHSEGNNTTASGMASHAEGLRTTASEIYAHAEGQQTTASGIASHAEGCEGTASGNYSHAEGYKTRATTDEAHAEGGQTLASGYDAHAEGFGTVASGLDSHAEGFMTKASGQYQHVSGKYNVEDNNNTYAVIVGNGTDDNARSNALTLDWSGNLKATSYSNFSSKKYKKNIKDMTEAEAKKLLELNPVSYDYKSEMLPDGQFGLIAEDVEKVMTYPLVYENDEVDSIDYSKFVPALIKMVQLQQKEIDSLKEALKK